MNFLERKVFFKLVRYYYIEYMNKTLVYTSQILWIIIYSIKEFPYYSPIQIKIHFKISI